MAAPLPLTRRAILSGVGAAAVLSVPVAAAMPKVANRRAWDAAMNKLRQCQDRLDNLDPRIGRVGDAYARLTAKVPHTSIDYPGGYTRSTSDEPCVRWARRSVRDVRYVEACAYADHSADVQLVDAADAREARIAHIDQRLGWSTIFDLYDELSEELCQAEKALFELPAPDAAAMLWKVERLWSSEVSEWADERDVRTIAELRRTLTGAVQ